jgi:hypothetical protein
MVLRFFGNNKGRDDIVINSRKINALILGLLAVFFSSLNSFCMKPTGSKIPEATGSSVGDAAARAAKIQAMNKRLKEDPRYRQVIEGVIYRLSEEEGMSPDEISETLLLIGTPDAKGDIPVAGMSKGKVFLIAIGVAAAAVIVIMLLIKAHRSMQAANEREEALARREREVAARIEQVMRTELPEKLAQINARAAQAERAASDLLARCATQTQEITAVAARVTGAVAATAANRQQAEAHAALALTRALDASRAATNLQAEVQRVQATMEANAAQLQNMATQITVVGARVLAGQQ